MLGNRMEHTHDAHHHDHAGGGVPWFSIWQSALIGLVGIMLLVKVFTGVLPLYIHTRYTPLIFGTGAVLLLLALVQGWITLRSLRGSGGEAHHHDHDHDHDHTSRSWYSPTILALLVPVLLGLAVPPQALGTAAIDVRGFGASGAGMRTVQTVAGGEVALGIPDPSQWTMLDWVNALIYQPDNPRLQGQPIELIGFVWQRAEMNEDQFVLSRFVVSCCTADSLAIGLPVIWEGSGDLSNDDWVRVSGKIGLAEIMGRQEAVIIAEQVTPTQQPAEPYLFP
jgi:putative membrane protein